MALELGLHRHESLKEDFPGDDERSRANRLFWCIYVLDRRWSFGTSLPFSLQDADIDPELPEPVRVTLHNSQIMLTIEKRSSADYLQCMIKYSRVCSKVWHAFPNFGSPTKAIPEETVSYLEFQLQSWQRAIPPHLRLDEITVSPASTDRTQRRLAALLYLRGVHAQILINRHRILSTHNIQAEMEGAQRVVTFARDGINVLVDLNKGSDIYVRQQVAFNYFLISFLAVIFLAVCHEPSIFRAQCKGSFHDAVELVRQLSARSPASKRLWKTVRALQHEAHKVGLHPDSRRGLRRESRDSAPEPAPNAVAVPKPARSMPCTNRLLEAPSHAMSTTPYHVDSVLQNNNFGCTQNYGSNMSQASNEWDATTATLDPNQMSYDLASWYDIFGMMDNADDGLHSTPELGNNNAVLQNGEISRLFQNLITG